MAIKRDSNCPLCGARLTAAELLDAGTELVDPGLGVVETHCPHCQGYLELIFIARFLERIGDQSTNVAEDTVFAVAAEDIRHLQAG